MAGAKQYEVLVGFSRLHPKAVEETRYEPGDTYTAEVSEQDLAGHDDQGPLFREKNPSSVASGSQAADSKGDK